MNQIYIYSSVLVLLAILYTLWCLNVAYPLLLDKHIKKGRSWLYLPLFWTKARKVAIRIFTTVLFLLVCAAALGLIWQFKDRFSPWILLGVFAGFAGLLLFCRSSCFKYRYNQQSEIYFHMHDKSCYKYQQDGKTIKMPEINNLTSFQFQNMLRDADNNGKFREALKIHFAQSKKNRAKKAAQN